MSYFNLPATLIALTLLNPLETLLIEDMGYFNLEMWEEFDLITENEYFKL